MSGFRSLGGTWDLVYTEGGGATRMSPAYFSAPTLRGKGLLRASVPSPIHKVLVEAGLLADPLVGLNSLAARWVEEMYWIYRHSFEVPAEAVEERAWLTFDQIELVATVYLNGQEVGRHANANRPARFEVTGRLRPGENLLVVVVETGIHAMADKPSGEYVPGDPVLTKRPFLRNPQYQHGWDWNPRLVNVGILGNVGIEWRVGPRLDQVAVYAMLRGDLSRATFHILATVEGSAEPAGATLRVRIAETGQEVTTPVTVRSGEQRLEAQVEVENPRLWWPLGHGEQHRYTVEVMLAAAGETQTAVRKTGVRLVEVDQSPHPVEGRYFVLKINQRPIFCKGANWGPADLFYSAVPDDRYRALVRLAAESHYNFFRVNGVGPFVTHALADACDEAGILLWHDLLFGCAKYPGDEPTFAAEVRREVTWAVRELAHHPSLVVWCGNNEVEWGDWAWRYDETYRTHPHYAMFHHDIPQVVAAENPAAFFWPSSPFSPGYRNPNDPTMGDQHPWGVSIGGASAADWWLYRDYADRFADEGGMLGASPLATLRQFMPEGERSLLSPTWEHHDNSLAMTSPQPGSIGRPYATVEFWTGRDPLAMGWEEYAFASALLQAEGLAEYVANYRRRMFSSAAAVFWNYNDSWPVTHGWTVIDYYLRRKLAYYVTRRAFQPTTVVVAAEADQVTIFGINDGPRPWTGEVRFGLFTLETEGRFPVDKTLMARLPANASTPLATIDRGSWEALGLQHTGAFAVLSHDDRFVAQHRLFLERFKDLAFCEPKISLTRQDGALTLTSDTFAWGVCLDIEGDLPLEDNCFDLLPGIPYAIRWDASLGEPRIVRIGSRDAVRPEGRRGGSAPPR